MSSAPTSLVDDRVRGLATATMARFKVELKVFFRNGQSLGFTLAFPIMMLLLFASIFTGKVDGTNVTFSQLYVAGLIGSSAMATGFVNTAIVVALDRQRGEIKRLAGTPMARAAFFLGRGFTVLVATGLQVAILLILGVAFYHLHLPDTVGRWLRFVAVLVLGVLAATLMGLAIGGRAANAKAVPAIVNLPFVFLQFISGVFIPFTQLSSSLTTVAGVFPLRWLGSGMRSVFLPTRLKRSSRPARGITRRCGRSWPPGAWLGCSRACAGSAGATMSPLAGSARRVAAADGRSGPPTIGR